MNHTYALSYRKNYKRASYKIKKQLWTAALLFAIVLTGIVAATNLLQTYQAHASSAYEEVVYYKSIKVSEGDTLWDIAGQYMGSEFSDKQSYIEEVKRINHLTDDTIHSGSYLMIPYTETIYK